MPWMEDDIIDISIKQDEIKQKQSQQKICNNGKT